MLLAVTTSISAPTSLVGRVYHNPNIMASAFEQRGTFDKKIADAKKEAIAKKEKEKGRKLSQKELDAIDKSLTDAQKQADALKTCLSVAITAEFTSPTDIVLKQKGTVDENGLKAAGVGWLKRKALKMALKMAPEAEKGKYEVKGNLVIIIDGKDRDTLTLGNDGRTLSGKFDEEMTFILNRTK